MAQSKRLRKLHDINLLGHSGKSYSDRNVTYLFEQAVEKLWWFPSLVRRRGSRFNYVQTQSFLLKWIRSTCHTATICSE
jgi:hypothetical protein